MFHIVSQAGTQSTLEISVLDENLPQNVIKEIAVNWVLRIYWIQEKDMQKRARWIYSGSKSYL